MQQYLQKKGYSGKLITALRHTDGAILLDGKRVFTNHLLKGLEQLKIVLSEDCASENIMPVNIPLDIVYEDEDILIVNKSSNMPVHPSIGNYNNTLANAVAYHFAKRGETFKFRAINRLDRDTTGLLIVAKNILSGSILCDMVKNRKIVREYMAICEGIVDDEGIIDAPIGRAYDSIIERRVDFQNGDRAVTHYKKIKNNDKLSLVALKLETGRTHQIRVHMKYINHPLIGDFIYNPNYQFMHRQSLHSYKLEFVHPITGVNYKFVAKLPEDMNNVLKIM